MTFYMSSQVKITKNTGTNSRRWMRILPYQLFVCVCVFVLVPDHKRNICECELRPADVLVRFGPNNNNFELFFLLLERYTHRR
jgi:hypothetical protein